MVVRTQLTSAVADKAQQGVMELLLINHPLDCPVCDKGGECPLQNQAMSQRPRRDPLRRPQAHLPQADPAVHRRSCSTASAASRARAAPGSPTRSPATRSSSWSSAAPSSRSASRRRQPFDSYFSGNTVQICPVGALTGAAYRFRSRPFDLVSTPTACEHCASGCALRTDHRRGAVLRRLAGDDPAGQRGVELRQGPLGVPLRHRAATGSRAPLVRDEDGALVETSWPEALDVAARGLLAARAGRGVGVLAGGRVTVEDAYAYAKFARVALGTNDVDFRARPHSAEEAEFLAAHVAGRGVADPATPTYADLEHAPAVVLVGSRAGGGVADRLPAAAQGGPARRHARSFAVAPFAGRGLDAHAGPAAG